MDEVKQVGQTLGQLQREVEKPIQFTVQRSKEYSMPPTVSTEKKARTIEEVQRSFAEPQGWYRNSRAGQLSLCLCSSNGHLHTSTQFAPYKCFGYM